MSNVVVIDRIIKYLSLNMTPDNLCLLDILGYSHSLKILELVKNSNNNFDKNLLIRLIPLLVGLVKINNDLSSILMKVNQKNYELLSIINSFQIKDDSNISDYLTSVGIQ